jgi:Na+-translocating ferredoxin:NAD+ oxidoreductase RnfG subunit
MVGDFDGDGDDDLAFAWYQGPGLGLQIRTKLSNRDGTYAGSLHNQGDGDAIWNKGPPMVGDFDGDGDDDLAFAWYQGPGLGLQIRTKLSNRDGTYAGSLHNQGDGDAIWNGSQQ